MSLTPEMLKEIRECPWDAYSGEACCDPIDLLLNEVDEKNACIVELEHIIAQWQKTWDEFTPLNAKKNQRLWKLEEALQYYASKDIYEDSFTFTGIRQPGILTEGGEKARKALEK